MNLKDETRKFFKTYLEDKNKDALYPHINQSKTLHPL